VVPLTLVVVLHTVVVVAAAAAEAVVVAAAAAAAAVVVAVASLRESTEEERQTGAVAAGIAWAVARTCSDSFLGRTGHLPYCEESRKLNHQTTFTRIEEKTHGMAQSSPRRLDKFGGCSAGFLTTNSTILATRCWPQLLTAAAHESLVEKQNKFRAKRTSTSVP